MGVKKLEIDPNHKSPIHKQQKISDILIINIILSI